MAPEQEARPRAFYDHENDEPPRRRRAAADWGVNEDIFDRMPSRFGRVERRPQHQEIVLRRDEDAPSVAVIDRGEVDGARVRGDVARGDLPSTRVRGDAARGGEVGGARVRGDAPARVSARTERVSRGRDDAGELDPRAAARAVMSWGEDLDDDAAPMVPGESRTIVLSREDEAHHEDRFAGEAPRRQTGEFESLAPDTQERRTIKISGHPDRLPAPRTQRPPRTAVERIGHRPDRIVAYAVALGFLLVLIAVLTTGQ
jgi:hypothetical protein